MHAFLTEEGPDGEASHSKMQLFTVQVSGDMQEWGSYLAGMLLSTNSSS